MAANSVALHLQSEWRDGKLKLGSTYAHGYNTYGKTLEPHDGRQQKLGTLLLTPSLLPHARRHIQGFLRMERHLRSELQDVLLKDELQGQKVSLYYAHVLRQSPSCVTATSFDIHQDTEEYNFIAYTVVVKLTTDSVDEAPSAMRVVGANSSFFYGPAAGASGCFNARLYHASVMPESEREHLKIAYFFRIIA